MSYIESFLTIAELVNPKKGKIKVVENIKFFETEFIVKFVNVERKFYFNYTANKVLKFLEIYETIEERLKKQLNQ